MTKTAETTTLAPSQGAAPIQASPKKTFQNWVENPTFKAQLAAALPKHLTPDRFIRVLLTATMRTPLLLECTQESLFKCVLDVAAAGLEIDGRRAHLIPFKNNRANPPRYEAQLIIDYKGLVELAMRSGTVSSIHADTVCDKDEFSADTGRVTHKVNYREPRGKAYAAYCVIRFKDGGDKTEVMDREEIEAIRARSKAGTSGPWISDPGEMWKKTVARRALKWVSLSPEIREHIERDDAPLNVTPTAGLASLVDGITAPHDIEASTDVVTETKPAAQAEKGYA